MSIPMTREQLPRRATDGLPGRRAAPVVHRVRNTSSGPGRPGSKRPAGPRRPPTRKPATRVS